MKYLFLLSLIAIILLITIFLFLFLKKEQFQDAINYEDDVTIKGNVQCNKNVTVNGKLNINKLNIGDVQLDKTKLNELIELPLVNLTNICLTDGQTDQGVCFSKEDIIAMKSLVRDRRENDEIYYRWQI